MSATEQDEGASGKFRPRWAVVHSDCYKLSSHHIHYEYLGSERSHISEVYSSVIKSLQSFVFVRCTARFASFVVQSSAVRRRVCGTLENTVHLIHLDHREFSDMFLLSRYQPHDEMRHRRRHFFYSGANAVPDPADHHERTIAYCMKAMEWLS